MHKFLYYLLGSNDYPYLLYLVVYAIIGVIISLFIHYKGRNQKNPVKFSLSYWIKDNWWRVILNGILILVLIRFSSSLIGIKQSGAIAFIIGVFNDRLSGLIQKKGRQIFNIR